MSVDEDVEPIEEKRWIDTLKRGDKVVIVGHGSFESIPAFYLGEATTGHKHPFLVIGTDENAPSTKRPSYIALARRNIWRFSRTTLREMVSPQYSKVHYYSLDQWDDIWDDYFIRRDLIWRLQKQVRRIETAKSPLTITQLDSMLKMIGDVDDQINPKSPNEQIYDPSRLSLKPAHIAILESIRDCQPDAKTARMWEHPSVVEAKIKDVRDAYTYLEHLTKHGYVTIGYLENWKNQVPRASVGGCRPSVIANHQLHVYNLATPGYEALGLEPSASVSTHSIENPKS